MDNAAAWAVIAGIITSVVVSFIKQAQWGTATKTLLAIVVSIGFAFVNTYFNNQLQLTVNGLLIDAAIVFSAATVFYKLWFEGTTVNADLTNMGAPPAPH